MSNLTNYINYFRQLAVNHYQLRHNVASESGDTEAPDKAFIKWNVDEIVTGMRTKIGKRCMLLELYEIETQAAVPYDIKENTKGAFTILERVDAGGTTLDEETAYTNSMNIVIDLLRQIWQDHYGPRKNKCQTPFYEFYFDKLDIMATPMLYDNHFGYRVEFYFKLQSQMNFMVPPAPGTFINEYQPLGVPDEYILQDENSILVVYGS